MTSKVELYIIKSVGILKVKITMIKFKKDSLNG